MRGLRTKFAELRNNIHLSSLTYDVIILVETWFNENFTDSEIRIDNYNVFRCDRSPATSDLERGGGALIAVRDDILSTKLKSISTTVEHVFVQLSDLNVILGAVYLPPNSPPNVYKAHMAEICELYEYAPNSKFFIVGDYNLPGVDWHNGNNVNLSLSESITANSFAFLQFNQRNNVPNCYGSLLDLVWTNCDRVSVGCSDDCFTPVDNFHPVLHVIVEISNHIIKKSVEYTFRNFYRADYTSLNYHLNLVN